MKGKTVCLIIFSMYEYYTLNVLTIKNNVMNACKNSLQPKHNNNKHKHEHTVTSYVSND